MADEVKKRGRLWDNHALRMYVEAHPTEFLKGSVGGADTQCDCNSCRMKRLNHHLGSGGKLEDDEAIANKHNLRIGIESSGMFADKVASAFANNLTPCHGQKDSYRDSGTTLLLEAISRPPNCTLRLNEFKTKAKNMLDIFHEDLAEIVFPGFALTPYSDVHYSNSHLYLAMGAAEKIRLYRYATRWYMDLFTILHVIGAGFVNRVLNREHIKTKLTLADGTARLSNVRIDSKGNPVPRDGHFKRVVFEEDWSDPTSDEPINSRAERIQQIISMYMDLVGRYGIDEIDNILSVMTTRQLKPVTADKKLFWVDKKHSKTTLGRHIRGAGVTLKDDILAAVVSTINSHMHNHVVFDTVHRGDAIVTAYRNEVGAHTCMTGSAADKTVMYKDYQEQISLLELRKGRLSGRALMWTTDGGKTVIDRVYPNNADIIAVYEQWAKENKADIRRFHGAPSNHSWKIMTIENKIYTVSLPKTELVKRLPYPFLDTFCFVERGMDDKGIVLSNAITSKTVGCLHDTGGRIQPATRYCDFCDSPIKGEMALLSSGSVSCEGCIDEFLDNKVDIVEKLTLPEQFFIPRDSYCDYCSVHSVDVEEVRIWVRSGGLISIRYMFMCDACRTETAYICDMCGNEEWSTPSVGVPRCRKCGRTVCADCSTLLADNSLYCRECLKGLDKT